MEHLIQSLERNRLHETNATLSILNVKTNDWTY